MVFLWNEDYVNCEDVVKGECSVSYLFKNCRGGLDSFFKKIIELLSLKMLCGFHSFINDCTLCFG